MPHTLDFMLHILLSQLETLYHHAALDALNFPVSKEWFPIALKTIGVKGYKPF
jgi:hypothetical protein